MRGPWGSYEGECSETTDGGLNSNVLELDGGKYPTDPRKLILGLRLAPSGGFERRIWFLVPAKEAFGNPVSRDHEDPVHVP
jgi:hypothetical protein